MKVLSTTRDITSYIKSFAISVVLINHYINIYVSDNYQWYANGVIALFFVLSGYGIFHSLQDKFNEGLNGISLRAVLGFYYSRALRIFPLYWIFLLLYAYVNSEIPPIGVFFGYPLQLAPGVGWFVTLLIQCYILAPFLYLLFRRVGTYRYLAIIIILLLLTYTVSLYNTPPYIGVLAYRHFFLGHVFLFALGIVLPSLVEGNRHKLGNTFLALLSFALFLVMVHYTRPYLSLSEYIAPIFILSAFAFCLFTISRNPKLPFAKILIFMGTYTYSIFLFHVFFYQALGEVGLVNYGDPKSIIFMLLLLPVFILICAVIEKYINKVVYKLSNWVQQRYNIRRGY